MSDEHRDNAAEDACIEQVELVTEYLEGALPPAEARRLERHVEGCPGCSEYLAQMRAVAQSLAGLSGDSIPASLRARAIASFGGRRAP